VIRSVSGYAWVGINLATLTSDPRPLNISYQPPKPKPLTPKPLP